MKKLLVISTMFLVLVVFLFSCKKDNNDNISSNINNTSTNTTNVPKIKTITLYSEGKIVYTSTCQYDSQGRLKSAIYTADTSTSTVNYIYSTSKIDITGSLFNIPINGTLTLNSNNLMISMLSTNGSKTTYEYNSSNYCTKSTQTDSVKSSTINNTYSNGNLINSTNIITSKGQKDTLVTSYTYFLDKINTIGSENTIGSYYGKQNSNLVRSRIAKLNNDEPSIINYTYEFNSKNRVSKQIMSHTFGTNTSSNYLVYTYID